MKKVKEKLSSTIDLETIDEKKKNLKRTSFWVPEFQPEAKEIYDTPINYTVDPMTGDELKVHYLKNICFTNFTLFFIVKAFDAS